MSASTSSRFQLRATRRRRFEELSDSDILALAISNEEEATRTYADFAAALHSDFPDSERLFIDMAAEETEHRERLTALFRAKYRSDPPILLARDITGIVGERPSWVVKPQGAQAMRNQARKMEDGATRFYHQAASRVSDPEIRALLAELAAAEAAHEHTASEIDPDAPPTEGRR
jgi:rubrerythrin